MKAGDLTRIHVQPLQKDDEDGEGREREKKKERKRCNVRV